MIFGIGSGMKIYTVHVKPGAVHAEEKPVFIKEGFNLYAFAVPLLWAIYQRAWRVLTLIAFGFVLLSVLHHVHVLSPAGVAVLTLGFHVLIGFEANDWLRSNLSKRGYIMPDVVASDSLLRAEQRYFERYLAAA